jgi:PleD family two-component response regulator
MDKSDKPADWLMRADKMLYAAKQAGRNAVRVDSLAPPVENTEQV